MSGLFDPSDDAATPLVEAERRDLKLDYISNRGELNAAEQENILRGVEWVARQRQEILTETFLKTLHRRMFGDVWRWAGSFRTSPRNIGIDAWEIPAALRNLLADTQVWIDHKTYPPDEIAVRFHHRLVQIHPFPNGNGRHARLAADVLARKLGRPPFPWGSGSLVDAGELRKRYIDALRAADRHDIGPLVAFARL